MSSKVGLFGHFRKLATFKGREDRSSFWPYAALAFGIVMVAGSLMTLPMMAHLMQAVPEHAAAGSGDIALPLDLGESPVPVRSPLSGPLLPVGYLAAYFGVTFGLAVLLYAAAVVRRLHDRGASGAWGLMPLPFLGFNLAGAVWLFDSIAGGGQPDPTLFLALAASNILGWAALLALAVLLAGASDPRPNRYGPRDLGLGPSC